MKGGLLAGILLYGCTPKLSEVKEKGPEAVLENLSVGGVLTDAKIIFYPLEYIIRCDNGVYFLYELEDVINGGSMCLGNFCYIDENDNGKVDGIGIELNENHGFVSILELPSEDNPEINSRYSGLLRSLKREQVHDVWKRYWRR